MSMIFWQLAVEVGSNGSHRKPRALSLRVADRGLEVRCGPWRVPENDDQSDRSRNPVGDVLSSLSRQGCPGYRC